MPCYGTQANHQPAVNECSGMDSTHLHMHVTSVCMQMLALSNSEQRTCNHSAAYDAQDKMKIYICPSQQG